MVARLAPASVLLLALGSSCAPPVEPMDADATGSTGDAGSAEPATTTTGGEASSGGSSPPVDLGVAESSTSSSSGSSSDGSAGAPVCDPIVPGEFNNCWNGTSYDGTLCNWTGTSESVGIVTCLMAALVENASVCIIAGCVDRCDCFAPPTTGTAQVECMEGIIADNTACVLYCGDGQQCPDGMVCGFNICVWEPQ